ncbi:hypothetical protein E3J38_01700 [candidate division TA06 bacterium]|uniref:Restriction endonuclease type IV Mrr domain-containing protein n=1 Tax=candidate division TA06 bacterium TaxID=2250710 RepID=A0A523XTU0_UNCT6|nr:MAG: hypothetical protein E3J38_01700 [candidate division TA06 bacterium]
MLPRNYVPPVVSILPRLARVEPRMEELCKKENKRVANVFEDLVGIAFEMLGYEVLKLGQGRGRRPDGIAFSRQDRYAIIYDAKSTKHEYELKWHSRQFVDYIQREKPMLMRQGMGLVFFAVVSGDFVEHQEREIKRIKRDSGVNALILLPADSLLLLIRKRLQDPYFSLGREGLLELLMDSGVLSRELIEDFFSK